MDIRANAAQYYDLNPEVPQDIPFYRERIPSPDARLLELGCGTGRVLVPLAKACGYIHGIDLSETMLSLCRQRLREAGIPKSTAQVEAGDITDFDLKQKFDLIIAPYRVFQNLGTDGEVEGLFKCVREHLAQRGSCILNVFQPKRDPEAMRREWCKDEDIFRWEVPVEGGRVTCHDRVREMDREKLILKPELVYRRYEGDDLKDETVLKIVMRCYYPQQFEQLILDHGFKFVNRWGGYAGERYGEGPELVIRFAEG